MQREPGAGSRSADSLRARLFVALELPAEVRALLAARARELRAVDPALRAVQAEAIHLTLRFLGAVDRDRIAALVSALGEVASRASPFASELAGLGAFPRLDAAQVVWVGVRPRESFERLASALDVALGDLGFAPDTRPFHPHVTIGRLKGRGRHRDLGDTLRRASEERLAAFPVLAVTLFESFLEPDGARYVALSRRALEARVGAVLA